MAKAVLLVGHCDLDSPRIEKALLLAGAGIFENVHTIEEAVAKCEATEFALVVGNRVIGFDQEGGLHLLTAIKASAKAKNTPVMILSGFAETQEAVIAVGGVPGFGKDKLEDQTVVEEFSKYFR
ncbi:MAG: hypothetical protein JXA52_00560 [Planctomycetes bacterium]|nr:hypothetical protein [Planctomycetota bacterium]